MEEVELNQQISYLLKHHSVGVLAVDEFVHTDLIDNAKFKARVVYNEINGVVSSRLDVMIVAKSETIIESFGDVGATLKEAVDRNFKNFALGSFHPILAAFGCSDPAVHHQLNIEEWIVNDHNWKVYIGNLNQKTTAYHDKPIAPPEQFFTAIENTIRSQPLSNELHWFRAYYCQFENKITEMEFLMDNEPSSSTAEIFSQFPVMPLPGFYSCRVFILLRKIV